MLATCAAHIQAMTRQAGVRVTGLSRLLVPERRLALLDESRHAFLLVLGAEQRVEEAPLEEHPFGEGGFVGAVHRLLRHHYRRQREPGDLRRDGERLVE